ncbi:MAG: hypothetical protein LBS70_02475, partial [Candidatus Accumulibacter sp.]|nr:hypothetical protein [Accumulibacter sp.]
AELIPFAHEPPVPGFSFAARRAIGQSVRYRGPENAVPSAIFSPRRESGRGGDGRRRRVCPFLSILF